MFAFLHPLLALKGPLLISFLFSLYVFNVLIFQT